MLKLYECSPLPNPRRVRIFMAEKGIDFDSVEVDVLAGKHREEEFKAINPWQGVPVLELTDGTHIAETQAICRYLDGVQPSPSLFGTNPKDQAQVEMWQRRVEQNLFEPLVSYFHYATPGLGEKLETYHNPDYGQFCLAKVQQTLLLLNEALNNKDYLAGDYSIADITGLCALDFAKSMDIEIPESLSNIHEWHTRLLNRPSAAA